MDLDALWPLSEKRLRFDLESRLARRKKLEARNRRNGERKEGHAKDYWHQQAAAVHAAQTSGEVGVQVRGGGEGQGLGDGGRRKGSRGEAW